MENKIHDHEFDTQAYIPKSILTTTIFSSVAKKDFNNKVNYKFNNKEYEIEINSYQPNLDIDFKLFCIFIRENKKEMSISIDTLIKELGHSGRIQKRDRKRILLSIERMMQTYIKIENKEYSALINLISYSTYDKLNKRVNIKFNSLFDLYINEKFFKFISIEDLNNLNQQETSLFLLLQPHNKSLIIKENDLFNKLFSHSEASDYEKKRTTKKIINNLIEKKYISSYEVSKNNVYKINKPRNKNSEFYHLMKSYNLNHKNDNSVSDPYRPEAK